MTMRDPDADGHATADTVLKALRRTRQIRLFTDEPVAETDLQAILEVARWSGSSTNRLPWMFMIVRKRGDRVRLAELAPYARHVAGAPVAIAMVMSGTDAEAEAYDEGRASERILVAASALGLGAGIGWAMEPERRDVAAYLGLVAPAFVRTIISLGHPTEAARTPRSAPGTARRPLADLILER